MKKTIIRTGLETLYFSGLHQLMEPLVGGFGVILSMHHVRPRRTARFQPNRMLEITPAFFEGLLQELRRSRRDLISIEEVHRRLLSGTSRRRFVCLTIDDGYHDILQFAYPLLRKYQVPFALYIPTSFPDRHGEIWWTALEAVIGKSLRISLTMDGKDQVFDCDTDRAKRYVFKKVYAWLRSLRSEEQLRQVIRDLAARHNVDIAAICAENCMDWQELRQLSADPLCTIGAHTVNHVMLKKLDSDDAVRVEMQKSRDILEASLGVRPQHLSYPLGDPTSAGPREFRIAAELGFKTAVTTRPGVIFKDHRESLTALPRIPVNGEFQSQRSLKVLISGTATAMRDSIRRASA